MDKKVIFLDIDGTLIYNHKNISDRVKEAIIKSRRNGHYIFLCTGRNRLGVDELMKLNCFDGAICSAGGYIEIHGQKIYEAGMSQQEVELARNTFDKYNIIYNMESNFKAYQTTKMTHVLAKALNTEHNSEIDRLVEEQIKKFNIHSLEQYDSHPETIQTIVYIAENEEDVLKAQKILSKVFNFLIYQKMNGDIINGELMKKGVDKGFGIIKVMEALNISLENSIGFGDSMNDLEMIETCHYSVVMDNGDDQLKAKADKVCESVKDDGIYHELKRLGIFN